MGSVCRCGAGFADTPRFHTARGLYRTANVVRRPCVAKRVGGQWFSMANVIVSGERVVAGT